MGAEFADARAAARRERRQCDDELAAFRAFRTRLANERVVASDDAAITPAGPLTLGVRSADRNEADASMRRLRASFRRTVMAVAHYDEVYDESLSDHVAGEFGPHLAAAVTGAPTLTPDLRDALLAATDNACDERATFVELLDCETASVSAAEAALAGIRYELREFEERSLSACGFDRLHERFHAVRALRRRVDELAADRQTALDEHRRTFIDRSLSVPEYLYADGDRNYPVLAAVAVVGERVDAAERRVVRSLTRRV